MRTIYSSNSQERAYRHVLMDKNHILSLFSCVFFPNCWWWNTALLLHTGVWERTLEGVNVKNALVAQDSKAPMITNRLSLLANSSEQPPIFSRHRPQVMSDKMKKRRWQVSLINVNFMCNLIAGQMKCCRLGSAKDCPWGYKCQSVTWWTFSFIRSIISLANYLMLIYSPC